MAQNHSYEELRAIALDILAGREKETYVSNQYTHLAANVAAVLMRREGGGPNQSMFGSSPHLSAQDENTFAEVFWSLFQERVIILAYDGSSAGFPWFRVSRFGKQILDDPKAYFFHDVATYETQLKKAVPTLNGTTLLYLKEAMQAFRSGCLLSATVMLGVAAEHTFLLLLETIEQNPTHAAAFTAASKERQILTKINKLRATLDQKYLAGLPRDTKEDLETHFAGVQSVIRTLRNEAGHPTGKIMDREQVYVLLHLFISYCRKLYQLMDFFSK